MHALPPLGRFPGVSADRMNAAQVAMADAFVSRRGAIPGPYKIWISDPPLAARLKELSDHLLRSGALSPRETEIAILVTARHLRSPFIEAAHRKLAAAAGLSAQTIDAICRGERPEFESDRESMVYAAAHAMHTERPAEQAVFDRAAAVLGHDGLSELAGLLGFYCACAFTLSFYAVEPPTV